MQGRNLDGTRYRFSQFRVKVKNAWLERMPGPEELDSLPEGWPLPLYDLKSFLDQMVEAAELLQKSEAKP
jgi:hypothetical protein